MLEYIIIITMLLASISYIAWYIATAQADRRERERYTTVREIFRDRVARK